MESAEFVCLNGKMLAADTPIFTAQNRAFRYGDALFETIRCIHLVPQFFEDHYRRLLRGMTLLKMEISSIPPREKLEELIAQLISKNRIYGDGRIRLSVFRSDGGLYTPASNKTEFLLEASPLTTQGYELNTKGLLTGLFINERKSHSSLNAFKSANSLLFVLAGLEKQAHNWQDILICNDKGYIIEGLSSNLFWIKDDRVFTPLRASGCVEGIMRKQILRLLRTNGYRLEEVPGATRKELFEADELFLTNAIQGIQWIVGFEDKRYYCRLVKEISRLLNNPVTSAEELF